MKPEHHLDCHVDHGGEIVTAPDDPARGITIEHFFRRFLRPARLLGGIRTRGEVPYNVSAHTPPGLRRSTGCISDWWMWKATSRSAATPTRCQAPKLFKCEEVYFRRNGGSHPAAADNLVRGMYSFSGGQAFSR